MNQVSCRGLRVIREQKNWKPDSWLRHPAQQIPVYPDDQEFKKVVVQLEHRPPLVHHSEIEKLKSLIGSAGQGYRFVLQAGECAERFIDCQSDVISEKLKILMQMSLMAAYGLRRPVVSMGRLAGQYGKPRSDEWETREGQTLPSYRGDIINGFEFSPAARRPDPHRMLDAYQCACATLNWIRALGESGWSDIGSLRRWSLHQQTPEASLVFDEIKERLEDALSIIDVWSRDRQGAFHPDRHPVFTSHEALLLPYEAALTRYVEESGAWFNQGAHFLWLGERTRDLNGAHVEYLSGIANPIGIKVGPSTSPTELINLVRRLNPTNEWGRITLITRLGAAKAADFLPALIGAIQGADLRVTWSCDPMHGNIVRMSDGLKTRYFDNIMSEVLVSQRIHHERGSWLGGLHLEITAEDVTECVGGDVGVQENHLTLNYQSYCDPRLNYGQSLEVMLRFCDAFKKLAHREVGSAVGSLQTRQVETAVEDFLG
ncbi:MAG: 3-deoxy-7-phosphoheptulonate synthase class II [Silvanigrellaceae bacterium]